MLVPLQIVTLPPAPEPDNDDELAMYSQDVYASWAGYNKASTSAVTTNGTTSMGKSFYDSIASNTANQNIVINDGMSVDIGDGVVLSGKVLKICLKTLLELTMKEYPEEFV